MTRQRPALTKTLSAFDFDVVTDAPRPPSRRPDPAPPQPATHANASERDREADRAETESR